MNLAAQKVLGEPFYVYIVTFGGGVFIASLVRRYAMILAPVAGGIAAFAIILQLSFHTAVSRFGWIKGAGWWECFDVDWNQAKVIVAISSLSALVGGVVFVAIARFAVWKTKPVQMPMILANDDKVTVRLPSRHLGLLSGCWWSFGFCIGTILALGLLFEAGNRAFQTEKALASNQKLENRNSGKSGQELFLMGIAVIIGGAAAYRRFVPKSAIQMIEKDTRRPILYLRSFAIDGLWFHNSREPLRFTRLDKILYASNSIERSLSKAVGEYGPFVAIGRPRENFSEIGAARVYLDGEDWRRLVCWLIARSQLVILVAGRSEGLKWEYDQVRRLAVPSAVVILLPIDTSLRGERRESEYSLYRGALADSFGPDAIPTAVGDAILLRFDDSWRGVLLEPETKSEELPKVISTLQQSFALPTNDARLRKNREQERITRMILYSLLILLPLAALICCLIIWLR